VLHWGGEATPDAAPRVALSYSFADGAFEGSAFDSALHLNADRNRGLPPIGLRLALVAGQAILYDAQSPLNKGQLALNNRIFASQQKFFSDVYADRVLSAAQTLKFMMAQQRGRKRV
jgi:hypothetical protein